jgi:putative protease
MPIGLATPRVVKPGEDGLLERILDAGPDAVLVRNLSAVGFFRERRPGLPLVGDFSLNVANELTAALLAEMGLVRLTPSIDLDRPALGAMLARISPALFEVVIHQHVPLFHMDHCPAAARLSDARDAATCGAPCRKHRLELRDRNGVDHPLWTDAACRTTVFRADARSAARHLPEMIRQGVRHFRVELLRESAEETPALLRRYARALAAGT